MSDPAVQTREQLVALRRALHRIPELGFEEHATSRLLRDEVGRYVPVRPVGGTGFVADLGPADAPRTLLLRADMDGLPVAEETGLDFASTHPGRMHACGHDCHMAALVVAGRLIAQAPPAGLRVRLLFQPAEEGIGGALRCIEDGALEGVDAAFGVHVWTELPTGTVALTAGGIMAGVVELTLRVRGRGGHGAMPHETADPVVAAAQLVLALQTVASRRVGPLVPVVLTLGAIQGGAAFNVIPDEVVIRGTVRTFAPEAAADVERHVRAIAAGVAAATDTRIDVDWLAHCIPTMNDPGMAALVAEAAAGVSGLDRVLTDYRTMAGEDFGYILREVPGCYALVGCGNPAVGATEPHHSPRFVVDEAALSIACGLHRAVAARFAAGE